MVTLNCNDTRHLYWSMLLKDAVIFCILRFKCLQTFTPSVCRFPSTLTGKPPTRSFCLQNRNSRWADRNSNVKWVTLCLHLTWVRFLSVNWFSSPNSASELGFTVTVVVLANALAHGARRGLETVWESVLNCTDIVHIVDSAFCKRMYGVIDFIGEHSVQMNPLWWGFFSSSSFWKKQLW